MASDPWVDCKPDYMVRHARHDLVIVLSTPLPSVVIDFFSDAFAKLPFLVHFSPAPKQTRFLRLNVSKVNNACMKCVGISEFENLGSIR